MVGRLPLALGICALVSTIALICNNVALAVHASTKSLVRTTSPISASLEAIVLALLGWFVSTTLSNKFSALLRRCSSRTLAASFGCALLACIIAAGAAIINAASLGRSIGDNDDAATSQKSFLVSSGILLGVCFACQLSFLVFYYFACRRTSRDGAESLYTNVESKYSPRAHVKAIPYTATRPSLAGSRRMGSTDSIEIGLEGRRPRALTTESPRPSLSHSIGPASSKTRLVSIQEKHRPGSIDSNVQRPSEDTRSSGDASHSPSVAQDISPSLSGKPRFLETIPASPVVSENPNFDFLADLEPPAAVRQRSRSYSPTPSFSRPATSSSDVSTAEQDIHPLFRSDSPGPPPIVTAGTSVIASPDAGKVIPHAPSNQSLRRFRSSSQVSMASPLSRKSSFEAPSLKQESIREVNEEGKDLGIDSELTPPTPGFAFSAGSR